MVPCAGILGPPLDRNDSEGVDGGWLGGEGGGASGVSAVAGRGDELEGTIALPPQQLPMVIVYVWVGNHD